MKNFTKKNSLPGNNKLKLNDFKEWLEQKNFVPETIEKYLRILNQYGKREVNTATIASFLRENLVKCEPATLRGKRNVLASYCKFRKTSIDWEKIARIIPKTQSKFFPTINYEELEKLKNTNQKNYLQINQRNNLILDFLFYTGLRVNELINLRHSDYVNGLLRIHGKGNKVRFILLPEFLTKYFEPYSRSYLFLTRNGKQLTKEQIRRNIKRKAKQADIHKNISPHSFRRSLATNLYNSGGKLSTIQKQLGHSSLDTTLGYIHNDYQTLYADYSKLWMMKSKEC